MSDAMDNLIQAGVEARERGLTRIDCILLIADVFAAPWTSTTADAATTTSTEARRHPRQHKEPTP